MRILGIHDGHNAAACLLQDGRIVAALQEERITRVKNHDVFPGGAVQWILRDQGIAPGDLDAIVFGSEHLPAHRDRARLIEDIRGAGSGRPGRTLRRGARALTVAKAIWNARRRQERLAEAEAAGLAGAGAPPIEFIEHHECHAHAAYGGSPWRNEKALVLTCDGAGDELCATASVGENGRLTRIASVEESASPAMIYLTVTTLLGMVPNEHEYKLMGMAPYAERGAAERACAVFESMLEREGGGMTWRRGRGVPSTFYCYPWLRERLEGMRFDAVCGGVQMFVERHLTDWVRRAIRATGAGKVALAGGIFMNVKANQAIAALPEVEGLFVYPSCGDETNAMGGAFAAYIRRRGEKDPPIAPVGSLYWGPAASENEMLAALEAARDAFTWDRPADLPERAAEDLAAGEIVARFDGRAEFGARALGNRSILAHPGRPDVVRRINAAIKSRDFWMPFACSIRAQRAADYLVNPKGLDARHMIMTFTTTARATEIEAGLHPADRTCRAQVVASGDNPGYEALLEAFERRTGTGGLLNTSFNLHGEPIVNTPAQALDAMRRSGLRRMMLGPFWVEKKTD